MKNVKLSLFLAITLPLTAGMLTLQEGYREDSFSFSISAPGGTPNVLSELKWSELRSYPVSGTLCFHPYGNFVMRAEGSYGKIYDGSVRDSDYAGDDRTLEFSRALAKAGKGEVFDAELGLGYDLISWSRALCIIPLAGYSYHEQRLRIYNGRQTINTITGMLGPIEGLDSSYCAKWHGPYIGLNMLAQVQQTVWFDFNFEYHWKQFLGRGDWNLRKAFISDFKDTSSGKGMSFCSSAYYCVSAGTYLTVTAGYKSMKCSGGKHKVEIELQEDELTDDSTHSVLQTGLHHVNWHSFCVLGGFSQFF